MSTPYNNQWILGRLRARWRKRAHPAVSAGLEQPRAPLREQSHERPPSSRSHGKHAPRSPGHGAHDRPRPSSGGAVRKRPRWVDRDT
jgi:hypothetical protein